MESNIRFNPYVKVPPEEEIVISGIAGRFPNTDNLKQLHEQLLNKVYLGSDNNHWESDGNNIIMPSQLGKVNNIDKFDAEYFDISYMEANGTDSMARILLQHTYEAIIDAGVNPKELYGSKTGVFIGSCYSAGATDLLYSNVQMPGLPIIGCGKYWQANVISRWLDLKGPSYVVDTACSSSGYALAEAYRMIRSGVCDAAIVGGSNLCLHPNITIQFLQLGVLSNDGYCRPFDEKASGYMRSEAFAIVFLQKAKDARRVYATFVYAKTNCDGFKEEGITFPSIEKQRELLEEFYDDCDVAPEELSFLEFHATGTLVGDPVEIAVIDQVLCSKRSTPLLMGSVKSNIGHSEPVSALCSVAKVLLAMETGVIPPNIHYDTPRKEFTALIEGRLKIVTEPTLWEGGYAAINSFGFGGANCHILLRSNPKVKPNIGISDGLPRLVAVSGRTEEAVQTILNDVNNRQLDVEYIALLHRLHAENIERHPYRGYTIVGSETTGCVISKIEQGSSVKRPICFVFSAAKVTYNNDLMQLPVFAEAIEKCYTILKQHGIDIVDMPRNESETTCNNTVKSFLQTVATQIGLVDLLTHIGIVPDYMMSYSIGDLICEYVDERFSMEETIMTAYYVAVACEQIQLQIDDSRHEIYATVKSELLEHFSRALPMKSSKGRGVIWVGRIRLNWDKMLITVVDYYIDNILRPASFTKLKSLLPKDTVLVNILSHDVFPTNTTNSLESTMTLVSLNKHDWRSAMQSFLEAIGDLYNIGLQPQISRLYPPVEFPVSRGTPMISPLVRWDYSKDYYVYKYLGERKTNRREMYIDLSTSNVDYDYMKDHVIDGKNLLPATGYLLLVWEMIGKLTGLKHIFVPIVFENIKFIRAVYLSRKNTVKITIRIQKASNYFEIEEGDNVIVTGSVRVPKNIEDEKLPVRFLPEFDDTEQSLSTADIYKELRIRGYQYMDSFRLLKSASKNAKVGCIKRSVYWVAFMDNMMQMKLLAYDTRNLYVPSCIRKLVIDPTSHLKQLRNLRTEEDGLLVHIYDNFDAIVSGGIEMYGLRANAISRKVVRGEAVHDYYCFTAHRDRAIMSLKEVVRMSMHIALEWSLTTNVRAIEYIEDGDEILPEDLLVPIIEEVIKDLPLMHSDLALAATPDRFDSASLPPNLSVVQLDKLPKVSKYLLAVGVGILTKGICRQTDNLVSCVTNGGFLLTRENLVDNYDHKFLQHYNLDIVLEKCTELETLILLKRRVNARKNPSIVRVKNDEFSWIDELKVAMKSGEYESSAKNEVIVVAQDDSESGILGLVNCLRREASGVAIRCVFIQDEDAPEFSLESPLYANQLLLNLPMNVLRAGKVWGSYRHFSLSPPEPKPVPTGYIAQGIRGDLSTLHWVEGRVSPNIKHGDLHRIVYAALNFKDIMIASGKLSLESFDSVGRDVDSLLGIEYVGYDGHGQRIMAISPNRAISNKSVNDNILSWPIPDEWTFEDAATVPCVYATCYYALYVKGNLKKGDKVLIHSGTGGIGQAAIILALHEGCEVFTTVGTSSKREFLKEAFPSIPDSHIGNSRDTSFEQMILQETHGRGVDVVLNSLVEEKLQASIRCLARGGRFLEIGKYDLISNNALDKTVFTRNISFYGVMLDRIIGHVEERKEDYERLYNYIVKGMKSGVIKPLPRKVFDKTEVETAFRYMAAGKHLGKVLIKISDERESLDQPILAQPRYFCEAHKSYVILGGLGGFGLELADWLILRGARKLLLISRAGIRNGYQRSRIELWRSYGAKVQIIAGFDASDRVDCEFILKSALELGPVDAIFNLAVALRDLLFKDQTVETFEESLKPKAMATKTLDELSRKMCPDLRHFVVFSSVSCGRGNAGQTNYGMANSIMERICERRAQDGLPGMAIQWGAIGQVGILADMQENSEEAVIGGTLQQTIQSCLQSLDAFLMQNRAIVSSMIVAEKSKKYGGKMGVLETLAYIMGLKDINLIGHNTRLAELGMDSMMAVEIKQTLEREFNIYLTSQNLRNLTFNKLLKLVKKEENLMGTMESSITTENFSFFIRVIKNLDINSDICMEMPTTEEIEGKHIFLLPGIEGCGSVFKALASKIKGSATCLQHGTNNISTCDSVVQSAATLLPHILTRIKDSAEFVMVGYSYGSLIAIELVRLLESLNLKGQLILIDGLPEVIKDFQELSFPFTNIQDFQNSILIKLMNTFYHSDTSTLLFELLQCGTWEAKLDTLMKHIPEKYIYSVENNKIYCTTIYKHLVAIREYDVSSIQPLKSPVLLLKPTTSIASVVKHPDLSKITEGSAHIRYVEGDHITILDNVEVVNFINGAIVLENNLLEM